MAGGMHYDKDGKLVPSFDASGEYDHRMHVPEQKPVPNVVRISAKASLHAKEDGLYLELSDDEKNHAMFNLTALARGPICVEVVEHVFKAVYEAKVSNSSGVAHLMELRDKLTRESTKNRIMVSELNQILLEINSTRDIIAVSGISAGVEDSILLSDVENRLCNVTIKILELTKPKTKGV